MAKLNEYNLKPVFELIREFSYTERDATTGETQTVSVTMFPSEMADMVHLGFQRSYGGLKAEDIVEDYKKGTVSAADLANYIKMVCGQKWHRFLQGWEYQYNPLWNVDGKEVRTIETEFGKTTTMTKGTAQTSEQLEDGTSVTTYGRTSTQTNNLTNTSTTTYGKVSTNAVSPFDQTDFNNKERNSDSGSDSINDRNTGTVANSDGGSDNVRMNSGKSKITASGSDTDTEGGDEKTTDTFVRSGNIGVTKSTELIKDHFDVWYKLDLFDMYFRTIAEEIALPIYEDEE